MSHRLPCNVAWNIHIPSRQMVEDAMGHRAIHRLREAAAEKITINLGYVDLGHIDLLVQIPIVSKSSNTIIANSTNANGVTTIILDTKS